MKLLTRRTGLWITFTGIVIFILNFLTYSLWEIDIDILGAMIFVLGLVITIACGRSMKESKGFFTRKTGVIICILAELILIPTAYLPFINGDIGGIFCLVMFLLGLILIVVRWNH